MTSPEHAPGARRANRSQSAQASDATNAADRGGAWLTITQACEYLGVDPSTLRRWTDAGKVPVFRTPGGHRRYAEADLRAFVGDRPRPQTRPRVGRQELTDRSLSAYEEEYLRSARERRWFRSYSTEKQEEHRRLGRRLVDLAIRYAAVAPTAADRASLLDEARQIGAHYGRSGVAHGLTSSEMVEAFLFFRFPVVRAVSGMIEEEGLAVRRAVRLFAEIGHFMEQVLIATVQAHEAACHHAEMGSPVTAGQAPPVLAGS